MNEEKFQECEDAIKNLNKNLLFITEVIQTNVIEPIN
jgi:hypothetical protein